ncbi:MAG: hypothetical protein VW475_13690, partial [Curvibacter sp.]
IDPMNVFSSVMSKYVLVRPIGLDMLPEGGLKNPTAGALGAERCGRKSRRDETVLNLLRVIGLILRSFSLDSTITANRQYPIKITLGGHSKGGRMANFSLIN